jgi:putative MATE family efflux protein
MNQDFSDTLSGRARMSIRLLLHRLGLTYRTLDITQGRLCDNIWQLSWPLIISQGLQFFPSLYDAYWLGQLGPYALAAAGLAISLRMTFISVLMALSAASGAVISRYVGAREQDQADLAAAQAVILFVLASGTLGCLGFAFARPLLSLVGAHGELLEPTVAYARVIFAGLIAMEMVPSLGFMLSSAGSPQLSLQMNLLSLTSFLALEPLLIWVGWDVAGAALALVLSNVLGMLYGLYLLATGQAPVRVFPRHLWPHWPMMWRILRIALPGVIQRGMPNLANTILMRFVAMYGPSPLAAFNLFNRVTMLALIPCSGLSGAVPPMVGQNLGAGKPHRAARAVNMIAIAASLISIAIMGPLAFWAGPVLRAFTQDPATIAAGVHAMRALAPSRPFLVLGMVMDGGLTGAGDTLSPMVVNIVVLWLVQLPLVWLLSSPWGWGVDGIWWGLVLSTFVQAALMAGRFWQGQWQKVRI